MTKAETYWNNLYQTAIEKNDEPMAQFLTTFKKMILMIYDEGWKAGKTANEVDQEKVEEWDHLQNYIGEIQRSFAAKQNEVAGLTIQLEQCECIKLNCPFRVKMNYKEEKHDGKRNY